MRILVTGGAGFVGSHIVDHLLARGHQITVVDNLSTGRREQVPHEVDFYSVSILDPKLADLCTGMDVVVHAAAQVSVAASALDPTGDALTNVVGTIRTLRAAIAGRVKRFVYLSSGAVYAVEGCLPIAEDHPLAPSSPYGLSKLTGEHYVRLLCEAASTEWVILRLANVYGPRQSAAGEAGVVARWASALVADQPVILQGDGCQTRDFIYVGDVAGAVAQGLANSVSSGKIFNIGTGSSTAIRDLLTCLEGITGCQANVLQAPPRPGDIRHSTLDSGAARRTLAWAPGTSLWDGLDETVAWARRALGK